MTATGTPIAWICETCGVQFEPNAEPPVSCPICEDERQYVGWNGQRFLSMDAVASGRVVRVREEAGVVTLSMQPAFGIGQRAFLIPYGDRNLMWESLSLVTAEAVREVQRRGGVSAMAISHPHFYAAMVDWSEALGGVPIYVHEADRDWVQRRSTLIRYWSGDRLDLSGDLALIHLPGHFAGSAGLWWRTGPRPGGSLFPGDALQVVMDRRHVAFMYSYPNAIPLGPSGVRGLQRAVAPIAFEDVFGFSPGREIIGEGKRAVEASFRRHMDAMRDHRSHH